MNILLNFFYLNAYTLAFHTQDFQINITLSGLLIVRDVILHNRPQIASGCTIREKSHNLWKTADFNKINHYLMLYLEKSSNYTSFQYVLPLKKTWKPLIS